MDVAPAPTTVAPPVSSVPPVFGGQAIGRLDRGPWKRDVSLVAGRDVGKADGYTTFGRAAAALAKITRGDETGAAAIFERDGRFYGQSVVANARSGAQSFHAGGFSERGLHLTNDAVRAVVDGSNYWDRQVVGIGPR